MKVLQRFWAALTGRSHAIVTVEPTVAPAPAAPAPPSPAATCSGKRGRPASASLLRTLDLLRQRPDITARELAEQLSVSPAYARTLLKRAQSKLSAQPVTLVVRETSQEVKNNELADLHARLDETEKSLASLRSTPPQGRGSWNLNRRAEVIRMACTGMLAADIAGGLNIPRGEVEFILKVDRLLQGTG